MTDHDLPNRFGLRFHHLGLAVRAADTAQAFLGVLGYRFGTAVHDPLQNVNLMMCHHTQQPDVEIIWPAEGAGPIDRLLAQHREGLIYHICYETDDLAASIAALEDDDDFRVMFLSEPKPATLFPGEHVVFAMVAGMGLIELVSKGGFRSR